MASDQWSWLTLPTWPILGRPRRGTQVSNTQVLLSGHAHNLGVWASETLMNTLGCCTSTRSQSLHLMILNVPMDGHRSVKNRLGCLTLFEAVVTWWVEHLNQKASPWCGLLIAFLQAVHIWAPTDLFEILSFIGKIRSIITPAY